MAFATFDGREVALGLSLAGFANQGMVAGRLRDRPDILGGFVGTAPALIPGTTMVVMPVSGRESRDFAACLYALDGR